MQNNKKLKKTLNNLIQLKLSQQNTVKEEIARINREKEQKLAEINQTELQIADNTNNVALKKTNFYAGIGANIFSHKEVYGLKIDLEKLDVEYNELTNKCKSLADELVNINERLKEKQQQLKALIVKEEKYKYMDSVVISHK
jgi:chromosome segregation ATPase